MGGGSLVIHMAFQKKYKCRIQLQTTQLCMKVVHYIGTFDAFFWGGGHPKKTGMSNNRKCTRLCNLYQVIKSPNSNA